MNIVSVLVGLSIVGTAMPMVAEMSIAPMQAQKRASNFAVAETLAVSFAGTAEAEQSLPVVPAGCAVDAPQNSVYKVTCVAGGGQYVQRVTRAFRILPEIEDGGSGSRVFAHDTPSRFSGHQCPVTDTWGVYGYNNTYAVALGGACKPQHIWNRNAYLASNPDDWLYDVNNHNGWGQHPDY